MDKCDNCGETFELQDGMYSCSFCGVQSQAVIEERRDDEFVTVASQAEIKITKNETKRTLKEKLNFERKWTTNDAFNEILKKMVDVLIQQVGASSGLKNVVLNIWALYLRNTKYAFTIQKFQKPMVPPLPRERDEQVLLEETEIILAKKFRKNFLKSNRNRLQRLKQARKNDIRYVKGIGLKRKRKKGHTNLTNEFSVSNETLSQEALPPEATATTNTEDYEVNGIVNNNDKTKKKRKQYKTKANTVSIKSVGKIGRMCMERVIEIIYLGLLLVHERVLLCDLFSWIKSSKLPLRESSHFLPENMKFQTHDPAVFRLPILPNPENIRTNTAHLAKFIGIRKLPSKNLEDIINRFVVKLNLPDEINILVKNVISYAPPKLPNYKISKKLVNPIPNYEGRALALIIVVLKLLFGLDGKTERKQSKYAEELNNILPDMKFFVWSRWFNTMERKMEAIKRKFLMQNLDDPAQFPDVDKIVNFYMNTGKKQKGKTTELRPYKHAYWQDGIRDNVRKPMLQLIKSSSSDNKEQTRVDPIDNDDVDNCIDFESFHDSTLLHITNPKLIIKLINAEIVVAKSSAWFQEQSIDKEKLSVYEPFRNYSFYHFTKKERSSYNLLASCKLAPSLLWLLELCSNYGNLTEMALYYEVILVERILITSRQSGMSKKELHLLNLQKKAQW